MLFFSGNAFVSSYYNNSEFSTIDFGDGPADECGGAGNWYYNSVFSTNNLNGLYGSPEKVEQKLMWWIAPNQTSMVKSSRMMLRAINDL